MVYICANRLINFWNGLWCLGCDIYCKRKRKRIAWKLNWIDCLQLCCHENERLFYMAASVEFQIEIGCDELNYWKRFRSSILVVIDHCTFSTFYVLWIRSTSWNWTLTFKEIVNQFSRDSCMWIDSRCIIMHVWAQRTTWISSSACIILWYILKAFAAKMRILSQY